MAKTEAQKRANKKYSSKLKRIALILNPDKADHMMVYNALMQVENKNQYLIDLVKKDLEQ